MPVGRADKDGSYVLTGAGRDTPDNAEQGSFAGVETDAPDFTFVARVAKAPEGTPDPQYGLTVLAGLAGTEKAVTLRYDGREARRCAGWFMRYHVTPSTHDGSNRSYHLGYDPAVTADKARWMKVVRRYPHVALYTSPDGAAWHRSGPTTGRCSSPTRSGSG
ncbi:MAG: hypothetical protein C0501_19010 [Isosphaera sp.]|nr:hypothetical protein [Isosphaera sp.]